MMHFKIKIFNKKQADSRWLSPWLLVILGIIGLIIIVGVSICFSKSLDLRELETKILTNKLVDSISENGYLKKDVLEANFNVLEEAKLDKKIMENGGNFYFNITIISEDSKKIVKKILQGTKGLEVQCGLPGKALAKCYQRKLILVNEANPLENLKIQILTVIEKSEF